MHKQLGEYFLSLSENMSKTCIISDFISEDILFYRAEIMKILQSVCSADRHSQFRVWLGAKEDKYYHGKVKETSPLEGESIVEWSQRIFGEKKFGMIVNNIESFSQDLNKKILHILDPIIQQTKIPAGGFDMALFIGNYGWTPLGIHKDLNGGKVIHFHLGPGPKSIYQWEDEVYSELYKRDPNTSFEELTKHAHAYHFKAGDLYFMNEEMWHIGNSDELSVGLTFWFNHFDRKELFKRLNVYLRDKLLVNNQTRLPSFSSVEKDQGTYDFPIASNNPFKEEIEKFFQHLFEDYKYEMLSNGGFYTPPRLRDGRDLNMDDVVQCVHPYKISYRPSSEERMDMFIRGYKTTVPNHPALPSVIEKLNSHAQYCIRDVAEPLLEDWNEDVVLYIFNLVHRHYGLDIRSEAKKQTTHAVEHLVTQGL